MVKVQGSLEEADVANQAPEDQSSQIDFFTPGGRRDTLRRVFGDGDTTSDEDDQGDRESNYSSRRGRKDEPSSPHRTSCHQRNPQDDRAGTGPFPPGPSDQEGRTPYSWK